MVSTVTTSTVLIVTNGSLAGAVALIGILILLALLLQKELAIASATSLMQRSSRVLDVGLFPLLFAFLLVAVLKVAEVLR